jgi:hypothetical protein
MITNSIKESTIITLYDGSQRPIQNLDYSDSLLVWNFDEGKYDKANILWLRQSNSATEYTQFNFEGNLTLNVVNDYNIFNKQLGKFSSVQNEMPIESTTFYKNGNEIKLKSVEIIQEDILSYSIITDKHLNFFANGILVSSSHYNNIYPIVDMKFVKDERTLLTIDQYGNVDSKYFEGLRLAEQTGIETVDTITYIETLEQFKL